MKNLFLLTGLLLIATAGHSQREKKLSKVMELQMPGTLGANGGSVAWHPVHKYYYAAMAGNARFPFAVFNEKGKQVNATSDTCGVDIRGLWYNTATKRLEANLYGGTTVVAMGLNGLGMPSKAPIILSDEQDLESSQAVGSYDAQQNKIVYLEGDGVIFIDPDDDYFAANVKDLPYMPSDKEINSTTVVAAGTTTILYGVLEIKNKDIYLLQPSTMELAITMHLPADAPVYSALNFGYANGIFWLFDKNSRKWLGYK